MTHAFPASVRAECVRELGDREDAFLMRRRQFSLPEPRHQAEVVGIDRAPPTLIAETAGFAVPIDHEPRGATGFQNAKSVQSSTCTANERSQGDARPPEVGADDGDAVRRDFSVQVPDHEPVQPELHPIEVRDSCPGEEPNRSDQGTLINALQSVRVGRNIFLHERPNGSRCVRRGFRANGESNSVGVDPLDPPVKLFILIPWWRAP